MPDESRFWDRIARRYAAQPVKDQASYEKTLDRTRTRLVPGDQVLELGCGTGTTALILAAHVAHVTASDISSEMLAIGREKAAAQGVGNVEFVQSDAAGHAARDERHDAILAFNLLHLVADAEADIRAVHGMLKPGGFFISKTVCLGGKAWLWGPMIWVMRLFGKAPRVRMFRVRALEEMISAGGFEIVETGTFPASPPCRFVVARKV